MNSTFLQACRGERTDYTPVWFMRQAGRYLPDYQRVRARVSFLELCKTPELAAEVTIQPVELLGVDAAILFSDILIPMEAMGFQLEFHEGHGPIIHNPARSRRIVDDLLVPEPQDKVPFVLETIRILRRALSVPLIGFAGAPFTLATYAIEGGSSKVFLETKRMMYQQPELYDALLDKITACTVRYLQAQAAAGAQALQIFDSWAGVLAPCDYERFALPHVRTIIRELRAVTDIPLIYFANNGATLLEMAADTGADVLGLDWRITIGEAARRVGARALQGNLDPCALFLPPAELEKRIALLLRDAATARGHIFNLGHGILPQTPPEQARIAVEAVHRLSRR
ncbi:MAG: uroporphyrinogen decarboxylase [Desulfobulbaceae bacterium A2]|nr:MAG: uroporphyrinogen decarboxylase [Desulfobulbaceae bacterium A2]